mmetsp:Transcript_27355/g.30264  ORF Transcript_27355/g.30264 Transcript_27355/m.30264 type:complete len:389 (-) Transcript_27355:86-1252(-)
MKYFLLSSLFVLSANGFTASTSNLLSSSRSTSTNLCMSTALIVQNKGGGHGELGFQLARKLASSYADKITSITILQDEADMIDQEPFKSYITDLPENVWVLKATLSNKDNEITAEGLKILLNNEPFDYVWDNCSKGIDSGTIGKAIIDSCSSWNKENCKLLTYVSSAGCYVPTEETTFPMSEVDTPVKDTSGQVQYENYATASKVPFVSFRPQYIYGPKSNKHTYIDWYFDRIVRDLPLPIPGDGTQLVSLTNAEDVASLLASPLNNEKAAIETRIFNCGTDQLVSYSEVAQMCVDSINDKVDEKEVSSPKFVYYDSEKFGKANFPFRLNNFYVAPNLAKEKLNWEGPTHSLKEDLASFYYDNYKQRGGNQGDVKNLEKDEKITSDSN